MIPLTEALKICFGLLIYYTVFQIFSDFIKSGQATNTKNRTIASLMTKYKVNIRTFNKNNNHFGFAWFRTIWINEVLFRNEKQLLSTFFHEKYHMDHHHKSWILIMRGLFSFTPLLLSVIHWVLFLVLFFALAVVIQYITDNFEKKANDYANKMMSNEQDVTRKRK